jgi:hypothetical protein
MITDAESVCKEKTAKNRLFLHVFWRVAPTVENALKHKGLFMLAPDCACYPLN